MVVGETVSFGRYEQDKYLPNTWEPINWRVLAVEDGKALLLAERVLDCRPTTPEETAATWQSCFPACLAEQGFFIAQPSTRVNRQRL
jgi:hypothetical protein